MWRIIIPLIFAMSLVAAAAYWKGFSPPSAFPDNTIIVIPEGYSLSKAADLLREQNVVRSSYLLTKIVTFYKRERDVSAGSYLFDDPVNAFTIAERISNGLFNLDPKMVLIPEGFSRREIADTMERELAGFNKEIFLELSAEKEGYLFPDTYQFSPMMSEQKALERMEKNFQARIKTIDSEIHGFGEPLNRVLTMASLLEEEATTTEDRRTIAGILWKRIELGIPLQVDAAFLYVDEVDGRNTYELTKNDLKVDSPYNTYTKTDLPPTPISNPGLDSILSAVTPIETEYLYYLSDRDGIIYYSKTFDEHLKKRAIYIE